MRVTKSKTPLEQPLREKRNVIIELYPSSALIAAAERNRSASYARKQPFDVAALFPDIDIDSSFPLTRVPAKPDVRALIKTLCRVER
jgi:hypothetical protein